MITLCITLKLNFPTMTQSRVLLRKTIIMLDILVNNYNVKKNNIFFEI